MIAVRVHKLVASRHADERTFDGRAVHNRYRDECEGDS